MRPTTYPKGVMSDYYTFQQFPILLRGEPATLVGKPGVWNWDDINAGTAALIESMEVQPADAVLDLGCGTGLIGLAAARLAPEGQVTLVDVNVAAVTCAQRTLAANHVSNALVQLGADTDAVTAYDLSGSESEYSNEVCINCASLNPIPISAGGGDADGGG